MMLRALRLNPGKLVAVAVLAIFLAAFWGGAHVSESVFFGLPHVEDEHAFLFQAKVFATGRLFVPSPPLRQFFPTQFVVDHDGKRFGKYPPGYPLVLSLGVLAGQARLVNPLLGALTLVVVFLIGRELYGHLVGLLAAGLGVVSPFFLMQSGSFMSHSTTLLFAALFVLFFVKGCRSPTLAFPLLAGICLGMASITRQLSALGIALPFVFYSLIDLRRGWRSILKYGMLSLAFATVAAFLFYDNYVLTGDPFRNPYELWWPFDKIGFGPDVGGGHTLEAGWIDTKINLTLLSEYLFGWPAKLSLAFLALPFLRLSRKLWDWVLLGSAAGLVAAYMAYWTSGEMYGPRYFYEALPVLLLLTARGVVEMWTGLTWALARLTSINEKIVGRRWRRRRQWMGQRISGWGRIGYPFIRCVSVDAIVHHSGRLRPPVLALFHSDSISGAVLAVLLAILVSRGLGEFLPREMAHFRGWYGITSGPLAAVKRAGIQNALVFVSDQRSWMDFAALDVANSPDYDSDVVFAVDLKQENGKLMQFYPGRAYYRMVGSEIEPYAPANSSSRY